MGCSLLLFNLQSPKSKTVVWFLVRRERKGGVEGGGVRAVKKGTEGLWSLFSCKL